MGERHMAEKKVIQLEDRIPKLKQQRRQKTNRRIIFYLTIFFILIMAVVYFESPLSNVRTIDISGNDYIDQAEILSQSGVTTKSKIWDIDEKQVAEHLEKLPMVKKAVIESHFPSSVTIDIKEYKRVAFVEKNGHYYPVLSSGKMMDDISEKSLPTSAPILTGYSEGKTMTKLVKQLTKLEGPIVNQISEITPSSQTDGSDTIQLYMTDGNLVLASLDALANSMNEYYPSVTAMQKKKGIIDLTVGGAVWKPFTESKKGKSDDEEQ